MEGISMQFVVYFFEASFSCKNICLFFVNLFYLVVYVFTCSFDVLE